MYYRMVSLCPSNSWCMMYPHFLWRGSSKEWAKIFQPYPLLETSRQNTSPVAERSFHMELMRVVGDCEVHEKQPPQVDSFVRWLNRLDRSICNRRVGMVSTMRLSTQRWNFRQPKHGPNPNRNQSVNNFVAINEYNGIDSRFHTQR